MQSIELTPVIDRRDFMKAISGSGAALALLSMNSMGRETGVSTTDHLIPADKNLDDAWLASLDKRGEPEWFEEDKLKYIGMPVGGIGCGQLYLGGDGRLWLWDIFKSNYRREPDHGQRIAAFTLGGHYANPVAQGEKYTRWNGADVQQGFLVRVKSGGQTVTKTLDRQGFPSIAFRGEYPVGKVAYAEKGFPVTINLEAFSPFIPLNARDSALPATIMSYTVKNTSTAPAEVDLGGWMQNATCPYITDSSLGQRRNRLVKAEGRVSMLSTVEAHTNGGSARDDIVFADFEGDTYGDWVVEGKAFGTHPFRKSELASFDQLQGFEGKGLVNTHETRAGENDPVKADSFFGTLTSPEFPIKRNRIVFRVGGGRQPGKACIELLVGGKVIASKTGSSNLHMRTAFFDVSEFQGKKARLRIKDAVDGGWGHVAVDHIVFSDAAVSSGGIEAKHGYGSTTLTLLHDAKENGLAISAATALTDPDSPAGLFDQGKPVWQQEQAVKPLNTLLVGGLFSAFELAPGESRTIDFAITWYFPDYNEIDAAPGQFLKTKDFRNLRRHYAPWFKSAGDVAGHLTINKERLLGSTREWNRIWYDSTLPHWLLDRTFIGLDCVASQMFHWFDNGRPYGWEGVDCCPGTCTHVWHYAQALGRVFPRLERAFREEVDFKSGVGFHPNSGLISDRGDFHAHEATDGQAGTILRAYREHLMSKDDAFLRRLWPNIRKAVEFLMAKDPDANGLLEGRQPHTLDAAWFGPMGWISGLYLAALRAGEAMALEMGDDAFSAKCRGLIAKGSKNIVVELFNGEYFMHKPDPGHRALQTGKGCHIDQVLGQAWTHQVGLNRVIPKKETVSALNSLWKYNFATDAGGYSMKHREIEKAFRWYAMPGEAGLLMCTWPKGGALDAIPGKGLRPVKNPEVWTGPGGYFNECMNGFEYQVAAHMVYEGEPGDELVRRGLAIIRAIHDRYAADKRNPYNEIECGDHYARSMASYGVFLAACGFEYHGPKGHIGFAPRVAPDNFKAPFTAAEGWGTFEQTIRDGVLSAKLIVNHGRLALSTIALQYPGSGRVRATVDGQRAESTTEAGGRVNILLKKKTILSAAEAIHIEIKV